MGYSFCELYLKLTNHLFCFALLQRIACYIQFFAFSRWLSITFPVEYYEFARGLQWSIPYFSLPWETGHVLPVTAGSNFPDGLHSYKTRIHDSGLSDSIQLEEKTPVMTSSVYGLPLTPIEYISFFEVRTLHHSLHGTSHSNIKWTLY